MNDINFESGFVWAGDPCYVIHSENDLTDTIKTSWDELEKSISDNGFYLPKNDILGCLLKVSPGKYKCDIKQVSAFGERVSEVSIRKIGTRAYCWESVARLGVDAGLMFFIDAKKIFHTDIPGFFGEDWGAFCDLLYEHYGFEEELAIPISTPEIGVMSSTGYGDGCYSLEVLRCNKEIVGMRVVFIDEDSECEDDVEYDDDDDIYEDGDY